ncbi:MAG TPA: hypothetical protein PLH27_05940 [bacterium]|nr:hypothetical protein [bacterium]HMW35932.1 hypothetical protein [bacterium]HMZ05080.1 hypothetical protein [bacterium]HNB09607.1 hypothetical protein [bacterium]HNB57169.1 hypothetical protein [bacterium]
MIKILLSKWPRIHWHVFLLGFAILSCDSKETNEDKVEPVNPYTDLRWRVSLTKVAKAITSNPVNPNTIYVNTYSDYVGRGGIFISYDRGETWPAAMSPTIDTSTNQGAGDVQFIAVCPNDTHIVFAGGVHSSGLLRTSNGGKNWVNVLPGVDADAEAMAFNPQNPAQVFFMSYTDAGFYVSQDTGRTWQLRKFTGFGYSCTLRMHPSDPNIFVAGASKGKIIKTKDQGYSWYLVQKQVSNQPNEWPEVPAIIWDNENPNKLYATISGANGKSFSQSNNGGETWHIKDLKEELWAAHMTKSKLVIFGGWQSTYITSDQGKNVFKIGGDETVSGYWSITSSGNRILAISSYDRSLMMVDL